MKTRVLLANDVYGQRLGLRTLLNRAGDIGVVGESEDGRHTVDEAERLRPGVVVLEVTMPRLNGIDATRRIRSACPRTNVIAMSDHEEVDFVGEVLRAGGRGYVSSRCKLEHLVEAVRVVAAGGTYFRPPLPEGFGGDPADIPRPKVLTAFTLLTEPQREVLQLHAERYRNREIAALLGMGEPEVSALVRTARERLGIASRRRLVKIAVRQGLVRPYWERVRKKSSPAVTKDLMELLGCYTEIQPSTRRECQAALALAEVERAEMPAEYPGLVEIFLARSGTVAEFKLSKAEVEHGLRVCPICESKDHCVLRPALFRQYVLRGLEQSESTLRRRAAVYRFN